MLKRSLLVLAMLSATAHAGVWDRALTGPADEAAKELYDAKMLEGDTATLTSTVQSTSLKTTIESIRRAEAAYRAAAGVRPREAEPYYRIGNLLYQMYFDCDAQTIMRCDPVYATPKRAELVVAAWDEFERRAPLDPRLGSILLRRAILSTKLVNGTASDHGHLESAARDYQASLDRSDGLASTRDDEQLLGNLAETFMMLGRLDESIATYVQAIASGAARTSTVYGLAVALDRDGEGEQALRRIQSQGDGGFDAFTKEYQRGGVFFVPKGEVYYYLALANEAFGNYGAALEQWNRYIDSGAHPEYQPRAREHIDQLRKKRVRPQILPESDDPNW